MRQYLEHLAAALGLLAFAVFISWFHSGPLLIPSSNRVHPLSLVVPAVGTATPAFTVSTSTLETLFPQHAASTTNATSTSSASHANPAPAKPASPAIVPKAPTPPAPAAPTAATSTASNTPSDLAYLGKAVVNIICVSHMDGLHSITGSGVFIDSRGIILTVAHVAQSVLLQEYLGKSKVSCVVRTGSPARTAYSVRPIYVSDAWVKNNATTLVTSQPMGTGEHDYALLAVSGSANGTPLPGAFPAIPLSTLVLHTGDPVYIGSYGAQTLSNAQISNDLEETLAESTVKDRYTFGGNTVDVLAINGSNASQEGSSGGAVADTNDDLVGLITTSEISGSLSSREMRTITPSYIERSYQEDTGNDFLAYFGNTGISTLINVYAPVAQTEGAFIAKAIGLTQ